MTPTRSLTSSFGITPTVTPVPSPVPGAGAPDGRSPNAKRPQNRETIAMAVSETKVLSQEDLSAGLNTLNANSERDRKWTASIAESVHHNAQMLDAMVLRINNLEASNALVSDKFTDVEAKMSKLAVGTREARGGPL